MTSFYDGVTETRKVFSSEHGFCREDGCNFSVQNKTDGHDELVNHYINAHKYRILHVGSETEFDSEGHLVVYTVVFLGR